MSWREAWGKFDREATELLAQADRRLARPGATKALNYRRDKCASDLSWMRLLFHRFERGDFTEILPNGRVVTCEPHALIAGERGWFKDLRDLLQRDFVRGDPDASRSACRTLDQTRARG